MNRLSTPLVRSLVAAVLLAIALPGSGAATEPADPASAAAEAVDRARAHLAAGRPEQARALLDRALAWTPDDPQALTLRAESHRRTDRLDAARDDYRRLSDLEPRNTEAWFWLATVERWSGASDAALESFGRLLALAPDHPDGRKGRARVLRETGDLGAAERDLRAVLELHPGDREAAELLASSLAAAGRDEEAESILVSAFDGADLELRLGELAGERERWERAARRYRRAARLRPGDAEILRRLGDAERLRGRQKAAYDAFREAARLAPADIGTLYWLAILAGRTGHPDEALDAWEAILAAEPDNPAALVGKARLLYYDGDRRDSLRLVSRALDATPENGEALTLRASILAASGRVLEARSDYRRILARDPENVDAVLGYRRLTDRVSWTAGGISDLSRVVEGLDEEGVVVDGTEIRATRIEYRTEGIETGARGAFGAASGYAAHLERRREAVTNLDTGGTIYDFDVLDGEAGLDHALSDRWQLSWRLGATAYDPAESGTIEEETRARGRATLEGAVPGGRLRLELASAPFIYRGFAADTQFEIFTEERVALDWTRSLGRGLDLKAGASAATYGDEDAVFAAARLAWRRGGSRVETGYRLSPRPERFLTAAGQLAFIDYDALFVDVGAALPAGLRFEAFAESGRFGAAPRTVEIAPGVRVAGPEEENDRLFYRGLLAYSPRLFGPFAVGVEVTRDEYDFDVASYNTINSEATKVFVELAGSARGRLDYSLRYARAEVDDDRDPDYERDELSFRLDLLLGTSRGVELALEGRMIESTLDGDTDTYDEELPRWRIFLKVPF